jgi:acyl transferase domain-containing protein/NADPH:quinone reductase-like Zn-dependent oxidoreductase/NAD(P)-dependent dehydrogenase (short-subunit alcohol dehydrogenase family)/acyl carrier protein
MPKKVSKVAIVGMAHRLPGGAGGEFWKRLSAGEDLVTEVEEGRWAKESYFHPRKSEPGTSYTFAAGSVPHTTAFDAAFFGISPREALQMDPQQRLLLELAWEALEDAGIRASALKRSRCGVFIGISSFDYAHRLADDLASVDSKTPTGNAGSIAANRISYFLDVRGPSMVIDTACSSALVAFHEACQSILSGDSDCALAGGVSLHFHPLGFLSFTKTGMLSRSGRCRTFDASADGYVRSEGGGILLLKPLEKALSDGDRVLAVVEGSGVNCDGRTPGITVPSGEAQADLLREVYAKARIRPQDLDYLEAHGTGTSVGDPIETWALGEVLGKARPKDKPLAIGSVKSNLGHLEAASAVAGWTKALLMLKYRCIPPNLHFNEPNPRIDFDGLNLRVVTSAQTLPERKRLVVGINSFGFGGANAHVVLSLPATRKEPSISKSPVAPLPFVFSAKTSEALRAVASQLADFLEADQETSLYDVAFALKERREWLSKRGVVWSSNRKNLVDVLKSLSSASENSEVIECDALPERQQPVFIFSGNGGQWLDMGRQLFAEDTVFRQAVREVDVEFQKAAPFSLVPHFEGVDLPGGISRAEIAQPLIFAIQAGLVKSLASRGIHPSAVIGHSLGEVAAAWACGLLSLESAVRVIRLRSLHQESARSKGGMTAVAASLEDVELLLREPGVDGILAVVSGENGPRSVTIAGSLEDLQSLEETLSSRGIQFKRLDLDYPFHSRIMDGVLTRFREELGVIDYGPQKIPFYSTVLGGRLSGEPAADYWARNIREPVRFRSAVESAGVEGHSVFLEIGPHPVLCNHILAALKERKISAHALPLITREADGLRDLEAGVSRLIAGGVRYEWARHFAEKPDRLPALPHYPWQREDYLLPVSPEGGGMLMRFKEHPLLGYKLSEGEWENHIDPEILPWLSDHTVGGAVLYPAAAFLESALAAGSLCHGAEAVRLEGFEIRAALVLPEKRSKTVRFELEKESGRFSIKSRDRMSADAWQIHVVGRIASRPSKLFPQLIKQTEAASLMQISSSGLYTAAADLGLEYGPSFQALDGLSIDETSITARLKIPIQIQPGLESHLLHPVFVDASMQSLISLFLQRGGEVFKQAFLPVRFESFELLRPHVQVASTAVTVRRHGTRSLLADIQLFDSGGELVAFSKGARFRAVQLVKRSFDRSRTLVQKWIPRSRMGACSSLDGNRHQISESIRSAIAAASSSSILKRYAMEGDALLDALCTAFALQVFRGLADPGGNISLGACLASRAVAGEMAEYFRRLAAMLEQDGLIEKVEEDLWRSLPQDEMPSASGIWLSLVADFPGKAARIGLVGRVGLHLAEILSGEKKIESLFPKWAMLSTGSLHLPWSGVESELQEIVVSTLEGLNPSRILWICGPRPSSEQFLGSWMRESGCAITILLPEAIESDDIEFQKAGFPQVEFVRAPRTGECWSGLVAERRFFDLIVVPSELLESYPASLSEVLLPGGTVVGIQPESTRLAEFLPIHGFGHHVSAKGQLSALKESFENIESLSLLPQEGVGPSIVLASDPRGEFVPQFAASKHLVIPLDEGAKFSGDILASALSGDCEILPPLEKEAGEIWRELLEREKPESLVFLSVAHISSQAIAAELSAVSSFLSVVASSLPRVAVTFVTSGCFSKASDDCWMASALWGFARVARNEFAQFRIRCIDCDEDMSDPQVLKNLVMEISSRDGEDEVRLTPQGRLVARVAFKEDCPESNGDAVLDFKTPGPFQNLKWRRTTLRKPGSGEVEIEVRAAGLNFRDVMYAMGLLPDEALENGFAGPTLGMEMAGVIVSTGQGVHEFRPGDEVIAFAPASFANRTVTSVFAVMPKPSEISFEAAATIPAAFFTAWHALVELADLKPGERVLIHGAAGGVGIAAIQIARWIGAEIFATAGSEEKRDFVKLLGVENIHDSRSLDFAEEILASTNGEGVDVVLNSLAGEAVSKNLEILRPFGRFLELGKRDFYENNRIGLRPFRNNIRYFAVDADQIMALRPQQAASAFQKLMGLFSDRVLSPLPYSVFDAVDVASAFRHMQHSAHTGKIVVRMDGIPSTPAPEAFAGLQLDGNGTYLVTGGMTGFGLQTAKWLVDSGARSLVLLSRRGLTEPEAVEFVEECRAQGVAILTESCDVTDKSALESLLVRARQELPPIRGVFHAAMVLSDSLIVNSSPQQSEAVVLPKIAGAANLDNLTRIDPLDFFVLYSSATTFFGNPGQAFYVAANTALEQLAQMRRIKGLPATCVSWGPLGDTGYLSRNLQIKEALAARTGGQPLESRDALRFLGKAMIQAENCVAWMDLNWNSLARFLPSATSPRFQMLARVSPTTQEGQGPNDLRGEFDIMDRPELIETLKCILKEEISTILRVPIEKLDENRSLLDLGMDSLMGVELMTSIENSLGVTIPMMTLTEAPTIARLAERLSHCLRAEEAIDDAPGNDLAVQMKFLVNQHGAAELSEEDMASITASLEKEAKDGSV